MSSKLPINLEDLLRQRKVEGDRIEYKKGWNPDPIMRTLCAFANDFENLGGGYVVIGQDCDETGMPVSFRRQGCLTINWMVYSGNFWDVATRSGLPIFPC